MGGTKYRGCIISAASGKNKTYKGFIWKYEDPIISDDLKSEMMKIIRDHRLSQNK